MYNNKIICIRNGIRSDISYFFEVGKIGSGPGFDQNIFFLSNYLRQDRTNT